jgi:hypothetical protein
MNIDNFVYKKPYKIIDDPYWQPISQKRKINWLRIFVSVNFLVNLYLIYCVKDLYQLTGDLGSALIFMSKVFEYVYHNGRIFI